MKKDFVESPSILTQLGLHGNDFADVQKIKQVKIFLSNNKEKIPNQEPVERNEPPYPFTSAELTNWYINRVRQVDEQSGRVFFLRMVN
jgi:hypothetical protein